MIHDVSYPRIGSAPTAVVLVATLGLAVSLGSGCKEESIGGLSPCEPGVADRCPSGLECSYVASEGGYRCVDSSLSDLGIQLVTSPPPQVGTCPADGTGALDKTEVRTVRVTLFDTEAGPPSLGSFICDRLLLVDDSGVGFAVPAPADTNLQISVEAFGAPTQPGGTPPLVASGGLDDVPADADEIRRVFMALTERTECAPGGLPRARAFHTVTALPGGYALVAGGLVATYGTVTAVAEGSGTLLTDELAIYNSETGQFVQPDVAGEAGIPRAFHSAFLLAGSNEQVAQVLLLGGVAQGAVPTGDGVVKIRTGPQHPLRFTPDPQASAAAPMLLTIDLTLDPPLVTRSSDTLGGWPSGFFQAGDHYSETGALVLGGATGVSDLGDFVPQTGIDVGYFDSEEHYPLTGTMAVPRLGHSVSIFSDGVSGLIWGGNLGDSEPVGHVAEELIVAPAPLSTALLAMDMAASTAATAISTAFHTATVLSDDDVLVTGGFVVVSDLALNPDRDTPIARIRRSGDQFEYHPQVATGFTPVGYHAAVGLPDNTVLITGGSPYFVPATGSCPDGQNAWTCSTDQAWLYTPGPDPADGGSLAPVGTGALKVPRFAHTMTLLENRTVLIVGGLHREEDVLWTEPSAEVYNAATGAPDDDPLGREPGQTYSAASECPDFSSPLPVGYFQAIVQF